ncbi:MAG: hypothetical protein H6736_06290 [Alphaproteobacteria bacterium]|nr:hypothetical protein [Alphaproteobacteria bacterium]
MSRRVSVLALLYVLACTGDPPVPTATDVPTDPPTPTDTSPPPEPTLPPPDPREALQLPAILPGETSHFATSHSCAGCHSNHPSSTAMRDDSGAPVSAFDLWQSSMMANAGRDPIWRAVVSAEIAATPGAAEIIGKRCMACHAPMAYSQTVLEGTESPGVETLMAGTNTSQLALDGVSCALCHQIEPTGLGSESSWKGNYTVLGDRQVYGPHPNPVGAAMEAAGWSPSFSSHINQAGLCATCHTLITDALDPDGTPNGGSVVEQAPLLEMLNSLYASSDCQSCHLPSRTDQEATIATPIARNADGTDDPSLPDRAIGRHVFVGGNTLVPALLRDNPEIFNPAAPAAAFDATIAAARAQLSWRTANLTLQDSALSGSSLTFDTQIITSVGHKFPTGIPLRRAWLRVQVTDADGATVFLSGDFDGTGRILVNGQVAPFEGQGGPIPPHHASITDDDQVQIYEAVLADLAGNPTYRLLRGAGYVKDNRLLPEGWNPNGVNIPRVGPIGTDGDPDYASGGDTVQWMVDTTGFTAPFHIDARLYYQSLAHRFGEEIFVANTPETEGLRAVLETADRRPDLVGYATLTVN